MHESALFFQGKQPLTNCYYLASSIHPYRSCLQSLALSLSLDRRDKNGRPRLTAITVRVYLNQSRGSRWSNSNRETRGSRPLRHLCDVGEWGRPRHSQIDSLRIDRRSLNWVARLWVPPRITWITNTKPQLWFLTFQLQVQLPKHQREAKWTQSGVQNHILGLAQ
jgi:hypothetical protein